MHKQRISKAPARPARTSVLTSIKTIATRSTLRPSTRFNQMQPIAIPSMSYKDLIKVVGVDPESNSSYWRKAIDHSAETVVFFQVDLRGTLPRMCKSVRICQEEENACIRLVPSVYIGETMLSPAYIKTIIGRQYLDDEDDLMKLLEHAGILEVEAVSEDLEEERGCDEDEAAAEEEEYTPSAKRRKCATQVQTLTVPRPDPVVSKSRPQVVYPSGKISNVYSSTVNRKVHQSRDASGDLPGQGAAIKLPSSGIPRSSSPEHDAMDTDVDFDELSDGENPLTPAGNECSLESTECSVPGSSKPYESNGKQVRTTDTMQDGTDEEGDLGKKSVLLKKPRNPTQSTGSETAIWFSHDEVGVLIDTVATLPVLWSGEVTVPGRPADVKQRAWDTVAAAVNRVAVENGEPIKSGLQCQKKWRIVLSVFLRIVRTHGKAGKVITTWVWAPKMMFVLSESSLYLKNVQEHLWKE
ncbi:uncharacterized protein LOC129585486 isoform X2 [Paramacrobiotus metropolitanus]|uniref:uncharacterized protein LOC129585486 isoform X2 n=1 Tax=Paramacrobiotus metropolitanus TaxID=2943436 RepID=UPI002445E5F9|nr:uncharacterized protein LOC129585486 isoform X2 [Paramacrobiotus metropolitanus]